MRSLTTSGEHARAYRAMSRRQLEFPEQVGPDELSHVAEQAGVSLECATTFIQWLRDRKADMEDPPLQK